MRGPKRPPKSCRVWATPDQHVVSKSIIGSKFNKDLSYIQ